MMVRKLDEILMGDCQRDWRYFNKIAAKLAGWVSHKDVTAMLPIAGP